MIYFFSTMLVIAMLVLAIKNGRDNGYPYLGEIVEDKENNND